MYLMANVIIGIEWEQHGTITLFTAYGPFQIDGLMISKPVSSSHICSRLIISHFIFINNDSNIATKCTCCSIYMVYTIRYQHKPNCVHS